jgi:hypothetical protein
MMLTRCLLQASISALGNAIPKKENEVTINWTGIALSPKKKAILKRLYPEEGSPARSKDYFV